MELEMEMIAREVMEFGQDITPPLSPLSFALYDSLLSSHCSSCFSPLSHSHNSNNALLPLYCSKLCSDSDSPLHVSSSEPRLLRLLHSRPSAYPHGDSSDLRAALRLLPSLTATASPPPRIYGLLTNRHNLLHLGDGDGRLRIRDGARAMFLARTTTMTPENDTALEEAALCLVMTNAVEVQDQSGRSLGIAVYDRSFSWINHSCSPNACYRFQLSSPPPQQSSFTAKLPLLRIVPAVKGTSQMESGVCSNNVSTRDVECRSYGPRVVVRSIKRIDKGEEVTVTYTDLLQPKAMRQSELWSRYRFTCSCRRCSASPSSYVDRALEETSASELSSDTSFDRDKATELLTDYVDDAIADYLSLGKSESSREKLEHVLTDGLSDNQAEGNKVGSKITYWLNPLHHLSLNAYTTLSSAYKILADDFLLICSEIENHAVKAFRMRRTSAAYSLLLAVSAHHLYNSESSLVVYVAKFWTTAGDSLLNLGKSPLWSKIVRYDLPVSNDLLPYRFAQYKCLKCSLIDKFETSSFHDPVTQADIEHVSSKFLDCITGLTQKVWYFLVHGCRYLGRFKNPLDLRSPDTSVYPIDGTAGGPNCWNDRIITSGSETEENCNQLRIHILDLGVHCSLYGEYLASKCYGSHSHSTCHVHNILHHDEILSNPCH